MDELRFDGRVAVVTGAGRGIGRAHADLLARRGATVVVNDIGGDRMGQGRNTSVAEQAARAIRAAGGSAAAGYGRVVMTTSHGILGIPILISYGAAKGAVLTLGRALAETGRDLGIRVNNVAPHAATRLTATSDEPDAPNLFDVRANAPTLVAPLVAYLCHETCSVTGETFLSGARRVARVIVSETEGFVHPDYELTPEVVAARWDEVMDETTAYRLTDTLTWTEGTQRRVDAVPVTTE
jgi:NAD(P)-dependent dehydrogenase (short-subunit alcohol dehydrogenase family)